MRFGGTFLKIHTSDFFKTLEIWSFLLKKDGIFFHPFFIRKQTNCQNIQANIRNIQNLSQKQFVQPSDHN